MTAARRTAKRTKKPQAPLGLRAVFAALQPDAYTSAHAARQAACYREAYEGVLYAQDLELDSYQHVVFALAGKDFPGRDLGPKGNQLARECPDRTATAGFWTGVAACWGLMNAINGKDGVR